jgi:type IV pilus assembly protein PilO
MGDILDRIAKLPDYQKLAIALILFVGIFALFHFLVNKKLKAEVTNLEFERGQLVDERDRTRQIAENKDQFERDVERLNEELSRALKELPNQREIPGLLRNISHLGRKNGLEFQLFHPLPEIRRDFYAEVPVEIVVTGTYHEVALFFDRVGKLPRIVNIRNVEMKAPTERSGRIILTTQGETVTYRFIEQEGAPAPAGGATADAGGPRPRR